MNAIAAYSDHSPIAIRSSSAQEPNTNQKISINNLGLGCLWSLSALALSVLVSLSGYGADIDTLLAIAE